ncbi:MAG: hypothetical protein ABUL48_01705, partial [Pseudorhodoplanes sp.]
ALRIQSASYFRQPDHNGAIRDDELALDLALVLSRDDILKTVINPQDVPADAPDQRVDIKFQAQSDYWLYCLTTSVEPRLFVDFQAEACVVIHDRERFSQMLMDASRNDLSDTRFLSGPAIYVDPLLPNRADVSMPLQLAKHFGYSYQYEYRFCWIPNSPRDQLLHHDIKVGSLEDIAELIVL